MTKLKLAGMTVSWQGPRKTTITELLKVKDALMGEHRQTLRTILMGKLEVPDDDSNKDRVGACVERADGIGESRTRGNLVTREIHIVRPERPFNIEDLVAVRELVERILGDLTRGMVVFPESSLINQLLTQVKD